MLIELVLQPGSCHGEVEREQGDRDREYAVAERLQPGPVHAMLLAQLPAGLASTLAGEIVSVIGTSATSKSRDWHNLARFHRYRRARRFPSDRPFFYAERSVA